MATITKGFYKFNDVPYVPSAYLPVTLYCNFAVCPDFDYNYNDGNKTVVFGNSFETFENIGFQQTDGGGLSITYGTVNGDLILYSSDPEFNWGWNAQASMYDMSELNGWGQIVLVLEDHEVSDTTYQMWGLNTTPYVPTISVDGEITEASATATVTYNGSTIASITNGKTATLSCKNKAMKDDIVIKL